MNCMDDPKNRLAGRFSFQVFSGFGFQGSGFAFLGQHLACMV